MQLRLLGGACAAAAFAIVVGGAALAETDLRDQVSQGLQREQISVPNLAELNEPQLRQIHSVLRGGETKREKEDEIQRIGATPVPCLGNDQLRASVGQQLSGLGITADVNALSGTQVAELHLILTCDECSQAARVQRVLAEPREGVGEAALKTEVGACLRRMNIDVADLDALTPQQIAELELILGSGDVGADARQQIETIVRR